MFWRFSRKKSLESALFSRDGWVTANTYFFAQINYVWKVTNIRFHMLSTMCNNTFLYYIYMYIYKILYYYVNIILV